MAGSNPPSDFYFITDLKIVFIYTLERTMQKNRYFSKPKPLRLNYGNSGFLTDHEGRIELIHLFFIKKKVKRYLLKKDERIAFLKEKLWFCITSNFLIQKKSKNSRMGKGKGLVERKTIRVRKNVPIFEFFGVPPVFLKFLLFKLNKKFSTRLKLIHKDLKFSKSWSNHARTYTYFDKYLTVRE